MDFFRFKTLIKVFFTQRINVFEAANLVRYNHFVKFTDLLKQYSITLDSIRGLCSSGAHRQGYHLLSLLMVDLEQIRLYLETTDLQSFLSEEEKRKVFSSLNYIKETVHYSGKKEESDETDFETAVNNDLIIHTDLQKHFIKIKSILFKYLFGKSIQIITGNNFTRSVLQPLFAVFLITVLFFISFYDSTLYSIYETDYVRYQHISSIHRSLLRYYRDHKSFPVSSDWDAYSDCWGENKGQKGNAQWIRGLVPKYMKILPVDPSHTLECKNQYLYKSNGQDFKLIALKSKYCINSILFFSSKIDPKRQGNDGCHAFGFWTVNAEMW